ncbi:BTB POZ domain-containing 2 [Brachionus plicatilis]|uniref:BTB POZ domain-containing 2 n=1 Tax=Brachionus plicatilis TaxID=10195 RepID=A0A3M7RMX5_BRAPC|nr:BTB POZ domain-containing 2 [Brachionus plicatilis]
MSKNNQLHNYQATVSKCKNCAAADKSKNGTNLKHACDNMAQEENVKRADNASNFCKLKNSSTSCADASRPTRDSCIIERLNCLYLSDSLADVHFLVGKRQDSYAERIPAHKLVLSIGSPVFMAMFYGTGSQMQAGPEIHIPDADPLSFKHMLKYLYTDELEIGPDSVMNTLYICKKYAVDSLEKECVNFLQSNLRADNAFMLLEQALLFDEAKLADLCLGVIDRNTNEAFSAECFLDINLNTLVLMLKRDSLGIAEFKLYNYVIKWAQSQCARRGLYPVNGENQRLVLGEAVDLIRFPLMSKEEFAKAMSNEDSRIIDEKAIVDIFINLTLANDSSVSAKNLSYSCTPRSCVGGKEQVINRFCQVESRWGYSGTSDRVRFSVNRKIFVLGLGLYGSIYGKCEYQAVIQLIHYDSYKTCAQNTTSFTCDGSNSTFTVFFKEPVEILADTDYIASATLKGPDSYYGTKGLRQIVHEVSSGTKITFNFQYASGNNNGTSVEDGQIPEIIFLNSCS